MANCEHDPVMCLGAAHREVNEFRANNFAVVSVMGNDVWVVTRFGFFAVNRPQNRSIAVDRASLTGQGTRPHLGFDKQPKVLREGNRVLSERFTKQPKGVCFTEPVAGMAVCVCVQPVDTRVDGHPVWVLCGACVVTLNYVVPHVTGCEF
jgi:hypothetical protein